MTASPEVTISPLDPDAQPYYADAAAELIYRYAVSEEEDQVADVDDVYEWIFGEADETQTFHAVNATGDLVGAGSITLQGHQAVLTGIAVEPGARGQGVGGRLLEQLEKAAMELGALGMRLWPHTEAAVSFFSKRGYAPNPSSIHQGSLLKQFVETS